MSTGTIRYGLHKKQDKDGKKSIILVYSIGGQRSVFRPKLKLYPANWNQKDQLAIYLDKKKAKELEKPIDHDLLLSYKEVEKLNDDLNGFRQQVLDIEKTFDLERSLDSSKEPYTSKMVIDKMTEKKKAKTTTETAKAEKEKAAPDQLFYFMDKYITDHKATRKPGSLSVYLSLKNHLKEYEEAKGVKVTFDTIDYSFFQAFQYFLLTPRRKFIPSKSPKPGATGRWQMTSLNNVTVTKQLSTIKTFINYARLQGQVVNDKYKHFKLRKESLEVIALTNEEFELLYYMDLNGNKRMAEIRDILCFSCATGLRYSDLSQLDRKHINREEIRIVVTKTSEPLCIPLNPYSHAIIQRYVGTPRPLPCHLVNGQFKLISNQKLNEGINGKDVRDKNGKVIKHVKGLCELSGGIDEPVEIVRMKGSIRETTTFPKWALISAHQGRKTFATLSLEKGIPAEVVMKIGGWSDYKSFQRYVKITEKRQKVAMAKAWGVIPQKDLIAV